MNGDKDFIEPPRVKAPLEKIIEKLKAIEEIGDLDMKEPIGLVQKFAQELEHEKANAILQIINNCHTMDRISFYRGKLEAFKKLQRDYEKE